MLKKEITYEDFDGNERTETFLFNLTDAEVLDWISTEGDYTLDKVLERSKEKRNSKEMMASVKDIIVRSYGEKSLDGRKFVKDKRLTDDFLATNAYSKLYLELLTGEKAMLDFLLGIIPGGMLSELKTNIGVQGDITIDNIEKFVEDSKEEEAKKLEVKDNK